MVLKELADHKAKAELLPQHELQPSYFQIAIDGPMGAGKTRVSEMVAKELNILFISTGQFYRTLTLLAIREQVSVDDEQGLLELLQKHQILLKPAGSQSDKARIYLDEQDVSDEVRSEKVSNLTPLAARHPLVRQEVVRRQQALVETSSVIMEGRDITHTVLPRAQLKIYLDAAPEVRAQRRLLDLQAKNEVATFEQVLADLLIRDAKDSEKNLKKVPGVWIIDTTNMTLEEVVQTISSRARSMMGKVL